MMGRVGWMLPALVLAGCGTQRDVSVTHGWVRLSANPGAPAAAYFTLAGGRQPETLVAVSTVAARRAELHESMSSGAKGGMTVMAPLASVPVPAGGEVAFTPGGRHVMLFDVDREVKPGGTVAMAFSFADGKRLGIPLKVVGPGDPAPY